MTANLRFKLVGKRLIWRWFGLLLFGGLTFLAGCYAPVQPAAPTPLASPLPSESYSPKVIPFFTTESDPAQIAILKTLVTEYQHLQPDVEIDMGIDTPNSLAVFGKK